MCVWTALALQGRLDEAGQAWAGWAAQDERLLAAGPFEGLRGWVDTHRGEAANDVLLALVERASAHGADDDTAAALLAWLMLPAWRRLARELGDAAPDADHLVAGQVWIDIKGWVPRAQRNVAFTLKMAVRAHLLDELGLSRTPRTRCSVRSVSVDPHGAVLGLHAAIPEPDPEPAEELLDLLDAAQREGVLSDLDRQILVALVAVAGSTQGRVRGSGEGLLGAAATAEAGARLGCGASTVRRRARRSLTALREVGTRRCA